MVKEISDGPRCLGSRVARCPEDWLAAPSCVTVMAVIDRWLQ